MDDGTTMTTAEVLGRYHKELLDQGIFPELAFELVRDAGRCIHAEGIAVRATAEVAR